MGWLLLQLWRGTWIGVLLALGSFALGLEGINTEYHALPKVNQPPIELTSSDTILEISEPDYDQLYVVAGDAMYDSGYTHTWTTKAFGVFTTSSSTSYYGVLEFDGYWLLVLTGSPPDENFTVYKGVFTEIFHDEREMLDDLANYFEGEFLPLKLSERSQGRMESDVWWGFGMGIFFLLIGLLGFYRFIRRIFQSRSKANAEPAVTDVG